MKPKSAVSDVDWCQVWKITNIATFVILVMLALFFRNNIVEKKETKLMDRYYLGIDNGGTMSKAALFNQRGKEIAVAGKDVKIFLAPQ